MKKSTIAISLVAALGVAAVGGAWFTGSQIEQRYAQLIENSNKELKLLAQYNIENAQIKDVVLTKGFFSSDVTYTVEGTYDGETYQFNGKDKLHYGPFPLNRLAKLDLAPVLFSAENHIFAANEETKTLFGQKELISGTTDVDYDGTPNSHYVIAPINTSTISSSEIKVSGNFSNTSKQSIQADKIKIGTDEENSIISGLHYSADFTSNSTYPRLTGIGPYSLNIDNLTINGKGTVLVADQIRIKGDSQVKNDRVDGTMDLQLDAKFGTNANNLVKVGQFHSDLAMNLDAKALEELSAVIEQKKNMTEEDSIAILEKEADLLYHAPVFKLNDFSLTNEKGKQQLTVDISLKPFKPEDVAQSQTISETFKIFNPSKIELKVDLSSLEQILSQAAKFDEGAKSEESVKEQMEQIRQNAEQSGLLSKDGKQIHGLLEVRDDQKMYFNGEALSEEQLQTAMLAIMFSGMSIFGH